MAGEKGKGQDPERKQKTVKEILEKIHAKRYGNVKPDAIGTPPLEIEDSSADSTQDPDEEK